MNVDRMRQIDYWVGVPLCFLSTWLTKIKHLFFPNVTAHQTKQNNKSKALIIALSEMGSIVLAEPALKKIAEKHELYFLTFNRSKAVLELLEILPEANIRTIQVDSPWCFIRDSLVSLLWARQQKLDWVVDLELFSRYSALLSAYSGATRQVGFYSYCTEGLYRGNMMSHKVAYNPHIHISKNFLALSYAMHQNEPQKKDIPFSKVSIDDEQIQLQPRHISTADKQQIKELITDYFEPYNSNFHIVLINSQGGDLLPMRNWGQESFLQLSRRILENFPEVLILMTGSKEEYQAIQILKEQLDIKRCINFAGATDLKQILSLYAISELMVTNDSGPNHFAALVDLPTYTLFGPETPRLYGSLGSTTNIYKKLACSPCVSAANHRKTICSDNQCMQQISVDEVFQYVEAHLKQIGAH